MNCDRCKRTDAPFVLGGAGFPPGEVWCLGCADENGLQVPIRLRQPVEQSQPVESWRVRRQIQKLHGLANLLERKGDRDRAAKYRADAAALETKTAIA